ncbi:hypothetical protein DY000_02011632 [Brassica cretica]|uniref:Uncharacterized protein n=1 Tax=Brassica cretica TaxID=69181 RepID=A0ABQ7D0P8_BRACR|nr:hypothetical protein DY000_02011632 [Brassica cretica]
MEDESHRWFWLMSDRRFLSSRKNLGYSRRRNQEGINKYNAEELMITASLQCTEQPSRRHVYFAEDRKLAMSSENTELKLRLRDAATEDGSGELERDVAAGLFLHHLIGKLLILFSVMGGTFELHAFLKRTYQRSRNRKHLSSPEIKEMENRGQKPMEVVEEPPADKRASNSQDFRPSTSGGSSVQAQANGTSSGHER